MTHTRTQTIIIRLFVCFCLSLPFISLAQSESSELATIFNALNEKDKAKVMQYAKYLQTASTETDLQKAERLQKADNTIPSEETSQKIMEFSRFMMYVQKNYEEEIDNQAKTKISFPKRSYDFGTVKEGDLVEYSFDFINTGDAPLTISDVKTSCGCTSPEWEKNPIPPRGKSSIKVVFNTKNKLGKQIKTINISANTTPKRTTLIIKGLVE